MWRSSAHPPDSLFFIPDHIKTQSMCDGAACIEPYLLASVPNCFKAPKMCDKAVRKECFSLFFLSDWFVTEQQVNYLRDDDDDLYDNRLIEWYEGYKKRKAQKTLIKEELVPIAWHPSRWWDWCVSEEEKNKRQKNCFWPSDMLRLKMY